MSPNPHSTARVAKHPIFAMLVPAPIICFAGTLVTDIVYAETANMQWANMSAWMLTVGLIVALFAVIAGVIDFLGDRRIRGLGGIWTYIIGNAIALILAIFNAFIHSRDAYTSVVPTGLILSALTVLILLVTGWMSREMIYRYRTGMVESGQ